MEIRGVEGQFGPGKINAASSCRSAETPGGAGGVESDSVQISPVARYLDLYHRMPEVRMDKVQAAREAIAAGQMDTPERLSLALDRMLEDILGE